MTKEAKKYFQIGDKSHRLLSAEYGHMLFNIRNSKYRDEDPLTTAERITKALRQIKNGRKILLEIAQSNRNTQLQRPIELSSNSNRQVVLKEGSEYDLQSEAAL